MAISDRIEQALSHYRNSNFDSSLLELGSAIEATAKLKWPGVGVGERFRNFIHEYRHFIFLGAFGWSMVPMSDISIGQHENTLAKILYKRMRNPSVHDAGVDDVLLIIDSGLSIAGPKFGLGRDFILALIICVIGDPVNVNEKFKRPLPGQSIGLFYIPFTNAWGHFDALSSWLYGQTKLSRTLPSPNSSKVIRIIGER